MVRAMARLEISVSLLVEAALVAAVAALSITVSHLGSPQGSRPNWR